MNIVATVVGRSQRPWSAVPVSTSRRRSIHRPTPTPTGNPPNPTACPRGAPEGTPKPATAKRSPDPEPFGEPRKRFSRTAPTVLQRGCGSGGATRSSAQSAVKRAGLLARTGFPCSSEQSAGARDELVARAGRTQGKRSPRPRAHTASSDSRRQRRSAARGRRQDHKHALAPAARTSPKSDRMLNKRTSRQWTRTLSAEPRSGSPIPMPPGRTAPAVLLRETAPAVSPVSPC